MPSVWKAEADVAIPDTKLTVGSLFAYIRGLLGRDTYVDGELTEQDQQVAVTVRVRGKPHQTVNGTISELDALMQRAAEHIMLETHPYVVAQFRFFKKRFGGFATGGAGLGAIEQSCRGGRCATAYWPD